MNIKKKKMSVLLGSIAFLFFLACPLNAYVLQGRHVLDLMIEKLGPAESLFVTERLVFYQLPAAVNEQNAATDINTSPSENIAGGDSPDTRQVEIDQEALELETLELEGTLRYVFPAHFVRMQDRLILNASTSPLTGRP